MTAPYRGWKPACKYEEPFNNWLRTHPELDSSPECAALSIQNVDLVIHRYLVADKSTGEQLPRNHLMLIELKILLGAMSFAQRDTLFVLDQVLSAKPCPLVKTARGERIKLFYHGLHTLELSHETPSASELIRWDEHEIFEPDLVDLLCFRRDAYTLRPREDRLHHRQYPTLFPDVRLAPGMRRTK